MWHTNGQLHFSGNYKNDVKDGEFQMFDESGSLVKKGSYQDGKLVPVEAVVLEMTYKNPEIFAQYIYGDSAFDDYLKMRSSGIESLKDVAEEKIFNLNFTVDKSGEVTKMDILSVLSPNEREIINSVFKELPEFIPASVENIPVDSELKFQLLLSKDGVKTFSEKPSDVYLNVDQMPIFPDGLLGMRRFIAVNIRYPSVALERKLQGKVLVNFVIDEEGNVTNIKIFKGVYPSLDAEAVRVVGLMPKWEPGRLQGKPVKVGYTIPIVFNYVSFLQL